MTKYDLLDLKDLFYFELDQAPDDDLDLQLLRMSDNLNLSEQDLLHIEIFKEEISANAKQKLEEYRM